MPSLPVGRESPDQIGSSGGGDRSLSASTCESVLQTVSAESSKKRLAFGIDPDKPQRPDWKIAVETGANLPLQTGMTFAVENLPDPRKTRHEKITAS